jgi:hypothetical protein
MTASSTASPSTTYAVRPANPVASARAGVLRFHRSVRIPLPPGEVFAFVTDFRNATRWDPRVVAAEERSGRPPGLGARFVLTSRVLGRRMELPYEVVAFDRPRFAVLEGETALLRYRDEIRVEADGRGGARLSYDARLSLRGVLVVLQLLLYPLLALVFRVIGDDALDGIHAALLAHGQRRAPRRRPMPRGLSPATVRSIVALDDRPILRNLLITHTYWRLSRRLTELLGPDANWCTYATWASKLAGVFVRRGRLDPAPRVTRELGGYITAGNLQVFAEIAEAFAAFIETFEDDARAGTPKSDRLEQFLARFRPGPSTPDHLEHGPEGTIHAIPQGGQDLLREAMAAYHAALFEGEPRRRSQLILLGNALGGLHEQTRLDSYIRAGLHAPLGWLRLGTGGAHGPVVGALRGLLLELREQARARLRELGTLALMRMPLPGEVLALGRDLPAPAGGPLYPPQLERIEHPRLDALLDAYGARGPEYGSGSFVRRSWMELRGRVATRRHGRAVIVGSAARDWGELSERMRYIFHYFRSRQRHHRMFEPPFGARQTADILAGRIPDGPL